MKTDAASTTRAVLRIMGAEGFPEVAVLRTATPTKVQLISEADGDFRSIVTWRLRGGAFVRLLQTCAIAFPSGGLPATIRGHSGYREGSADYWAERGYELVMDPGGPAHTSLMVWLDT